MKVLSSTDLVALTGAVLAGIGLFELRPGLLLIYAGVLLVLLARLLARHEVSAEQKEGA